MLQRREWACPLFAFRIEDEKIRILGVRDDRLARHNGRVGISHGEMSSSAVITSPALKHRWTALFLSHDVPRGFADEPNVVSSDKETVNLSVRKVVVACVLSPLSNEPSPVIPEIRFPL